MPRPTSTARKTMSSATRREIRKEILEIKAERASRSVKKKAAGRPTHKTALSVIERYLGHFGVGPTLVNSQKGSPRKKTASRKKAATRKTSQPIRRAS